MTQRWSAPLCLSAAAMLHPSAAKAGVWGSDPVLGVTADYATNPVLLDIPHTAQTDAAVLIDAPTTFNGDDFKVSVLPSFRIGDTKSYTSINSDYEHLTVKGEYDTERSVATAATGVTRDSNLYQDYLSNGEAGARRDGATADLDWDRLMTERLELNADVNTMRVRYSAVNNAALVDYKYTSVTPTVAWNTTERDKFTLAANAGQYDSLDGNTRSRSANVQIGFIRPLTEMWSLSVSGGFSRALNRVNFDEQFLVFTPNGPEIETIPGRSESSQNGAVYTVNFTRQGERWTLNAIATRQEVPTGFAFLSRQSSVELRANYTLSPRWSFAADAHYTNSQDPQSRGPAVNRTVDYFGLNSSWQWTEHWTLTFAVSRVSEHFQSTNFNLTSNQAAITLSRQFNHFTFQ
jgi:hypothetical protein